MNLSISDKAVSFYQSEMNLYENDPLWLFVRVGGIGSGGFSVGVAGETPDTEAVLIKKEGLHIYVTEEDVWYFEGLTIDYDTDIEEITFSHSSGHDLFYPNE
ncbi:HesB/YadR/YfhF family protein [Alkalicoccus daliensis]|uniref:Uncharacterized protein YneR n=1 Tax=Alkalicoccus daliensis TaxID=745820 RepID=A0A1H0AGK9_9BACI|nr:iron-sulfur cluster biosynthesis family protein [Alkalicoccus daliensis]SDN32517.1 Uncharacterized protein YneR [Alkalicoccus daliensis]